MRGSSYMYDMVPLRLPATELRVRDSAVER
jgi:hypothetical protein